MFPLNKGLGLPFYKLKSFGVQLNYRFYLAPFSVYFFLKKICNGTPSKSKFWRN